MNYVELLDHQPLERRFRVQHDSPPRVYVPVDEACDAWMATVGVRRGGEHPANPSLVVEGICWKRVDSHNTIVTVRYAQRPVGTVEEWEAANPNLTEEGREALKRVLSEDGDMSKRWSSDQYPYNLTVSGCVFAFGASGVQVCQAPRSPGCKLCYGRLSVSSARELHRAIGAHLRILGVQPLPQLEEPVKQQTTTGEGFMAARSPWRRWLGAASNALSILLVAGGCGALGYFTEWYVAVAPPVAGVMAWAVAKLIRRRWGFYRQQFKCANCQKTVMFRFAKGQARVGGVAKCPICGMKCRLVEVRHTNGTRVTMELAD